MIRGFTCSCFDLFHAGHVLMLKEAKDQCDYLIVGLQTDPTLDRPEKMKPIQSVYERFVQVTACKYMDIDYFQISPFHLTCTLANNYMLQLLHQHKQSM